jgi:hypothetical protein
VREIWCAITLSIVSLQKNTLAVLEQLSLDDVNWRPNSYSNSIANLVLHIDGYIKERIENGILHKPIVRSREDELGATLVTKETLEQIIQNSLTTRSSPFRDLTDMAAAYSVKKSDGSV